MDGNLVWMDLEMTGLDADRDTILEIATLVTDSELRLVEEGPNLAIRQDEAVLAAMDEWNQTHHGRSGLLDRVRGQGVAMAEAEAATLAFVSRHCARGKSPLCGNSVWQDRKFLERRMPALAAHFHYRNVDVSTIKELARRWYPGLPAFPKREAHLALDDIRESLGELRYYREKVFAPSPMPPGAGTER